MLGVEFVSPGRKFLTYEMLQELNAEAVRSKRNRSLYFDRLPITATEVYPVVRALLHNGVEMRCKLVLNSGGDTAWLDIPTAYFNALPEAGGRE